MNVRDTLVAQPLTSAAFVPFGTVLEIGSGPFLSINEGRCRRFHDLARPDVVDGAAGVSLFQAEIRPTPCPISMMERHPLGSQCFLPMDGSEYLVVVAPDQNGRPSGATAFHARGDQGVNYNRNVWHAVLTPISGRGLFAVVDRIGEGKNLEEHWFDTAITVELSIE